MRKFFEHLQKFKLLYLIISAVLFTALLFVPVSHHVGVSAEGLHKYYPSSWLHVLAFLRFSPTSAYKFSLTLAFLSAFCTFSFIICHFIMHLKKKTYKTFNFVTLLTTATIYLFYAISVIAKKYSRAFAGTYIFLALGIFFAFLAISYYRIYIKKEKIHKPTKAELQNNKIEDLQKQIEELKSRIDKNE